MRSEEKDCSRVGTPRGLLTRQGGSSPRLCVGQMQNLPRQDQGVEDKVAPIHLFAPDWRAATDVSPEAVVLRGDAHLQQRQADFRGEDCGPQCVDRIPAILVTQSAWLFLSFALQPDPISSCAPSTRRRRTNSQQPTTVWRCVCPRFCAFFRVAVQKIRPDCHCGKEALDSGTTQPAAHWANWEDATKMVKDRSALDGGLLR